jgi:hypothetical protein
MKHTFGYPVSPCTLIGSDEKEISKVTISCGGGMGGSKWCEYGNFEHLESNQLCGFKDAITGERRTINTAFVVEVETGKLVKVDWDTTAHANYGASKPRCEKCIHTRYYFIPTDDEYEIVNEYRQEEDKRIKTTIQKF